jgi:hypothetical protein
MRISYSCPEHLKFALTIERWTNLVELTGDAIDWLDQNDKLYDVWMLVAYAATSCALVQVGVLVTCEHFSEFFVRRFTSTTRGHGGRTKMLR